MQESTAPGRPPEGALQPADEGSAQLRKGLLYLAGFIGLLAAVALYAARMQQPSTAAWDDDPPRWSWAWFTEPLEFDRWLRPTEGAQAPQFRSLLVPSVAPGAKPAVYAAGEKGVLLRSADAGRTWTARRIEGAGKLVSVAVGAPGALLVLDEGGRVWRSEDGGRKWTASVPAGSRLRSLAYAPDGQWLLAVGDRVAMRSDNHGANWRVLAGAAPRPAAAAEAMAVPQQQVAKVGLPETKGPAPNANRAWSPAQEPVQRRLPSSKAPPAVEPAAPPPVGVSPAAQAPELRAVLYTGAQSALGATPEGLVRTSDGGQTWNAVALNLIPRMAFRGFAGDGATVLALGDAALLRSTDGGSNWSVVIDGRTPLRSVSLAPGGRDGLALRQDGTLLRTRDGGRTWSATRNRPAPELVSLATVDGLSALATDKGGALLRASGAEELWTPAVGYARYPAPWFLGLAGFLMVPPVGAGLLRLQRRKLRLAKKGLLDNGVSDEPISRAEQDRLAFGPAVEALALFLRHSATTPPLAIAINAPWGMGKTSFMRMLVHRLRELGARPVWFNVWHHQHEEVLLAPLLQAITRQATPSWWRWQGWRFRARLVLRRMRKLNNWGVVASLVGLLLIPVYIASLALRAPYGAPPPQFPMIDHLVRDLHSVWNFLLGGEWLAAAKSAGLTDVLGAAFGALRSDPSNGYWLAGTVILFICFYLLVTYLLRPFPASPAILAARLNSKFSVSQAEAKADFRQRFREHFADVAHALAPRTLTIFIDDLDRCEPAKAAELLEAVNYLCEAGPCYVVLGMARELVEAQVASAHKALAEEQAVLERARGVAAGAQPPRPEQDRLAYARKYLRKLVQLDVQLPGVDAAQALYLLLQKQARQEDGRAALRQRLRAFGGACFMPLTLLLAVGVFAGALVVQVQDTVASMEREAQASRKAREAKLERIEGFLRESRRLEQGLRLQADPARTQGVQLANLRSDADVVAGHIKAVEAAVPLLQKESGGFDKLLASAFAPHEASVQKLRDEYTSRERKAGDNDVVAAVALQGGAVAEARTPAAAGGEAGEASTGAPLPAGEHPTWPYVLAGLPVLLLVLAALTYRDRYVVEPTREYEAAVTTWQRQLLANGDTSSPRELKRFMNVSRYVVARGQTDDPLKPDVPESIIVEFSARWLIARAQGLRGSTELLAGPGSQAEREQQARWFLQVVGDISG